MKLGKRTVDKIKSLGVGLIYFFGSRVQGNAASSGDFDIGIVFTENIQPLNLSNIHPILYEILTDEFKVSLENDLDIVYLQEASLPFRFQVISEGKVLFEIDPIFRANYEEKTIKQYLDFKPIEKIFSSALLDRQ
jgi:predicted nucleotidyltransferase